MADEINLISLASVERRISQRITFLSQIPKQRNLAPEEGDEKLFIMPSLAKEQSFTKFILAKTKMSCQDPNLSIIIPALNEEKYLPVLLKEIKKQNFANVLEIIVADAGSLDRTVEIAKSFGCKVVQGGLPAPTPNLVWGPAKGRNEGAKIARADILLFMDADNIYLPENFLKNLLEEFKKRNLDVASFPICPDGNFFDKIIYKIYNNFVQLIQRFSAYATNSVLVKKNLHQKIGGFDEEIKIAEDHFYAKTGKKFGKFGFIKTEPVLTSIRRFERDGRLKTYLKYLIAGIYMFFFGPIKSDIFKYRLTPSLETPVLKDANNTKKKKQYHQSSSRV